MRRWLTSLRSSAVWPPEPSTSAVRTLQATLDLDTPKCGYQTSTLILDSPTGTHQPSPWPPVGGLRGWPGPQESQDQQGGEEEAH